jgi:hypothetical protein
MQSRAWPHGSGLVGARPAPDPPFVAARDPHGVAMGCEKRAPLGLIPGGGAGSHGVAVGCERGAPLGRIPVGAWVPHGVAMGCEKHAPLGRIPGRVRVATALPWARGWVPRWGVSQGGGGSHGVAVGWRMGAPLGRTQAGIQISGGRGRHPRAVAACPAPGRGSQPPGASLRGTGAPCGCAVLGAPKVHFPRQPTATPWVCSPPRKEPCKGVLRRPLSARPSHGCPVGAYLGGHPNWWWALAASPCRGGVSGTRARLPATGCIFTRRRRPMWLCRSGCTEGAFPSPAHGNAVGMFTP